MFEQLAAHRRILVTGPQRSGTTIASQMIALDTGHRCIDEAEFGVYDVAAWRRMLTLDDVVIQCPHMLKVIVDEPRPDVLVVLMRRDLEAVHASEDRIRWEEMHRGNSAELAAFGLTEGSSAEIKYAYWEAGAKPEHFVELSYESLREHPLYVPSEGRVSFGRKETRPTRTRPMDDAWREWMAAAVMLGIDDEHIRSKSQESGYALPAVDAELIAIRGHPYYQAGRRLGYRVRKLEAVLDASRTVSRAAGRTTEIDRRSDLSEAEFVDGYYRRNRPVVIGGLTDTWPARRWTPQSLATRLGATRARVTDCDGIRLAQQMLSSAFIEALTGEPVPEDEYLSTDPHALDDPASGDLRAELQPLPPYLDPAAVEQAEVYWGPAGLVTGLHYDVTNVLLVELAGSTRVLLVSPDQTPLLYNTSGTGSEVDPESPDSRRHPAFADCRPVVVVLEPGDALFVPVTWWYHLRTLEPGVSLAFRRFTVDNTFAPLERVAAESGTG